MRFLAALLIALDSLAGCATTGATGGRRDPWEGFNRKSFAFNDAVDRAVLKPVAQGYQKVTPGFAQEGVNNFFGNLEDVGTGLNNFLQGKSKEGASRPGPLRGEHGPGRLRPLGRRHAAWASRSTTRISARRSACGACLPGPYFVIPFLGPSTARDAPARVVDPELVLRELHRQRHALLEHLGAGQGAHARQPAARRRACSRKPRSTSTRSFATRGCSAAATRCTTATRRQEKEKTSDARLEARRRASWRSSPSSRS